MKKLPYKNNPIGSIESLALALGISSKDLIKLATKSDQYFYANKPEIKPNGKVRQTYRVHQDLKKIQSQIVKKVFYAVAFPEYLQGSIKDPLSPRDCISNANLHAGNAVMISEDITNFFPSIGEEYVLQMWMSFFRFPRDVAKILTQLTTFNGFVPQGAPTSSYVANLVFWKQESALESEFSQKGWTYSRYVDDITVSSKTALSSAEKTKIITSLYGMFSHYKVAPNRKKHIIANRSGKMRVHNLNVNGATVSLPRKDRQKIRAAVKQCERDFILNGHTLEYSSLHAQTVGRANRVRQMHANEGGKLLNRLKKISPVKSMSKPA